MKIPCCSGRYYEMEGDYDCDAMHDKCCEDCFAAYRKIGGLWHPETGKHIPKIVARILFGKPSYD
jgi:hypothetical protein